MQMREARTSSKRLLREKLAATSDPVRLALISALARSPASSNELAARLDQEPRRVRYLLRRMREVGLIDLVGRTTREGVRENLYSVDPGRFILNDEETAEFTPLELDRALASMARLMVRETTAIVRTTPSKDRLDSLARIPLPLDSKGWQEAAALHTETLSQVVEVGRRSRERLAASGEEEIHTLAMVLFIPIGAAVEEAMDTDAPHGE